MCLIFWLQSSKKYFSDTRIFLDAFFNNLVPYNNYVIYREFRRQKEKYPTSKVFSFCLNSQLSTAIRQQLLLMQ